MHLETGVELRGPAGEVSPYVSQEAGDESSSICAKNARKSPHFQLHAQCLLTETLTMTSLMPGILQFFLSLHS